ncbi:MAG: EcsC family protein [Arenimonas sp.]
MVSKEIAKIAQPAASQIADVILDFISKIPSSAEQASNTPKDIAREKANKAAAYAALASGTLSLPPGPLGWLTILPDLLAVWKIQSQMVADIAAIYGKTASLSKEQMLYCLFRHLTAQAFRDLTVRVGERVLVKPASLKVMQSIAEKVGVKISQRALGKGLSRWIPVIGAVGVGAYAYYDTAQVAATAIELFESDTLIPIEQ